MRDSEPNGLARIISFFFPLSLYRLSLFSLLKTVTLTSVFLFAVHAYCLHRSSVSLCASLMFLITVTLFSPSSAYLSLRRHFPSLFFSRVCFSPFRLCAHNLILVFRSISVCAQPLYAFLFCPLLDYISRSSLFFPF